MKKVSIIVPVYNMENSITMCVESMLKQTYSNIEIVMVDDGSKDFSYVKCKKLSDENSNVKVYHTENKGSGLARNYGIEMATGDYAYFPDADDFLESNAIEILVDTMQRIDCDLVVFGYKNVNSLGKIISEKKYVGKIVLGADVRNDYDKHFSMSCEYGIQGAPWNKLFDLHKIKENNIQYPSLRRHQDEVFISRYVNYMEKVCFISDVFYTYFTNDLKKEWDKYPQNYLDIVMDLKQYRNDIILCWNPRNDSILDCIEREYICNAIKALELVFSKKINLDKIQRKKKLKESIYKAKLKDTSMPERFNMRYQELIMSVISKGNYTRLYWILFLKVFAEKNFTIHHIKTLLSNER